MSLILHYRSIIFFHNFYRVFIHKTPFNSKSKLQLGGEKKKKL